MNFCTKCGKELKPGLKFCTGCGTPTEDDICEKTASAGDKYTTGTGSAGNTSGNGGGVRSSAGRNEMLEDTRPLAPTIVIGPAPKKDPSRLAKSIVKGGLGFLIAVAVIIIGVWTAAWVVSNFHSQSQIEEVDNAKSKQLLALVDDVRNPNFDEIIADVLNKSGRAEDYSFLQEYTDKFDEILGDEYTEEEKLYADCCYYVWYTEYEAKRYEWLSNNSGLLNYLYIGKADSYRKYADTLYDMLIGAQSDTDLKNIRIYCVDHKIISDK